jgi:integral membrane protein (TIGR01906 family)
MADVRAVFGGFALVALVAVLALIASWIAAGRRDGGRRVFWRAVDRGARVLGVAVVLVGVVALVAFDFLFEIFHRLFFASGTYTFDPRSERLVQLFPFGFWFDTAIAVGALILALAVVTAVLARRRATGRAGEARAPAAPALEGAR